MPSLAEKLRFLGNPAVFGHPDKPVIRRETHMSFVFLIDGDVFKLKKPVRFPYLDFSTRARREAACRAELEVNRRLAPDVYRAVVPLTMMGEGLRLGGDGPAADWLVVMRRLDESTTLETLILEHRLIPQDLERIVEGLVTFYRHAKPIRIAPARFLADWRRNLADNARLLLEPRLGLPAGLVRRIDAAQRRFLRERPDLFLARLRARRIVDGHGDLRPEHIFIGERMRIIDGIEFNPRLRMIDPMDEVAYLCVECDRLGASFAGDSLRRRVLRGLGEVDCEELFRFYRCYRACLRARLAAAHLLEPDVRMPEKWPRLARAYLDLASADMRRL
jgi:aminoglycoside phosphotransferase family enzyme